MVVDLFDEFRGQVRSSDRRYSLGRAGRAALGAVVVSAVLLLVNRVGADGWSQAWVRTLGWPYSWLALVGYIVQFVGLYDETVPSRGVRQAAAVLYWLVGGGMMLFTARTFDVLPWWWAEIAFDVLLVLGGAAVLARGLRLLLRPNVPSGQAERDGQS